MNTPFLTLFADYTSQRAQKLTEEHFSYLLKLFPSMMVCMCDGKLDEEEWIAVKQTTKSLVDQSESRLTDDERRELEAALTAEFRFLLDHIDEWKEPFLLALKSRLEDQDSDKDFVRESMYLFANIADGISEVERQTIEELSRELNILE